MRKTYLYLIFVLFLSGCEPADIHIESLSEPFKHVVEDLDANKANNLHSLIIWQDGQTLVELYRTAPGRERDYKTPALKVGVDELHNLHSVTKSFVATLVFIAIDEGKIAGLDQAAFSFYPEYQELDLEKKMTITIGDLLNMSSGFPLNELISESYQTTANHFNRHYLAKDLDQLMFNLNVVFDPGSKFSYSGFSTVMLSRIVERVYDGEAFNKLMKKKLFDPLGITQYEWMSQHGSNVAGADWGLRLTSRDLLKFGQLYLNQGKWDGHTIFSDQWISRVESPVFGLYPSSYGMHFWQPSLIPNSYAAIGIGEQYVIIIPSKKSVIIATGGNYDVGGPTLKYLSKLASVL
ncbi:beta-lactamase family protein [Vibrio lamellibrachiae]|uniref:serine hydrolase domain-containing protein n=1 Tax=Vibrio lamellibrachiae TaxID=2910253 RepID=UPI003D105960